MHAVDYLILQEASLINSSEIMEIKHLGFKVLVIFADWTLIANYSLRYTFAVVSPLSRR